MGKKEKKEERGGSEGIQKRGKEDLQTSLPSLMSRIFFKASKGSKCHCSVVLGTALFVKDSSAVWSGVLSS